MENQCSELIPFSEIRLHYYRVLRFQLLYSQQVYRRDQQMAAERNEYLIH